MLENKPVFLITGLPGSGKTARGVEALQKAAAEGRPIFQTGIPELTIPHIPVPPISEWTELRPDPDNPDVMCPYFTFPERAVIYVSEAQRWFRPRPNGSKVPDHVAAFETTRHTGVTFILDTQHPDFIDSHVRKLVGQHVHLLDHGMLGRWHYEWPYQGRTEDFKNAPIKKKYTLPKHVFDLYKSSSLHIKRKYTIHPRMVLLALIVVAASALFYRMYDRMSDVIAPTQAAAAPADRTPTAPSSSQSQSSAKSAKTAVDFIIERTPVVPGQAETAPIYDGLRQVKAMPIVAGCIATANRCKCVNQQGTDAGLDDLQCRNWMKSPPFDPYRDPPKIEENRPLAGDQGSRSSRLHPPSADSVAVAGPQDVANSSPPPSKPAPL